MRRGKPINPVGPKVRKNQAALAIQTKAFDAVGIQYCEARLSSRCGGTWPLHFAHSRKRPDCSAEDLLYLVIRCCDSPCHKILDQKMQHAEMEQTVLAIIRNRGPVDDPFFQVARELAIQRIADIKQEESR
jgi:hypothetical protein